MEKFMSYSVPAEILGVVYNVRNKKTQKIYYQGCLADAPSIIHFDIGNTDPDDIIYFYTIIVRVEVTKKSSKDFGKKIKILLYPWDSEILKKASNLTHKKVEIRIGYFIDDDKKNYITSIKEIN